MSGASVNRVSLVTAKAFTLPACTSDSPFGASNNRSIDVEARPLPAGDPLMGGACSRVLVRHDRIAFGYQYASPTKTEQIARYLRGP
jgi:hypothetical protein